MATPTTDTVFTGSVAQLYESHLVPLIFEPYAVDMARRVAERRPRRVLEIAAGTGVVTRHLAVMLDAQCEIVATDLNAAMLEEAQRIGTARPVQWRVADAMQLPFDQGAFDVVVCQFGAMFFPDRPHAYGEARRVLAPGGAFLFNVWDSIETSEFTDAVTAGVAKIFPQDPPRFLARTPHGYHDPARIRQDLAAAGFTADVQIENIAFMSRAVSPEIPAIAFCQGTPLRGEIEARDASGLARATQAARDEMARRFGEGPVEGQIRALVVSAPR
jgi:ubiquinone/menaquinone biosynthesis C-methylase UbiE